MSENDWVDDNSEDSDWVDDSADKSESASPIVSGIRNFVQGGTAGFSDELAGGVEAAGRAMGLEGLGHGAMTDIHRAPGGASLDWQTLRDAYRKARDSERGDIKQDMVDNPTSSMVGQVAGAVVSPINKLNPMAVGAGAGLGTSDADLTDPTMGNIASAAGDTLKGGALGFAGGKLADSAVSGLKSATSFDPFTKELSLAPSLSGPLESAGRAIQEYSAPAAKMIAGPVGTAVASGVGLGAGGPMGFVASNYAKSMAKPYIEKGTKLGLDKIGQIVEQSPEALGKFAGVLKSAAQRGSEGVAATHFILQQTSPEYRETLDKAFNAND